MGKWYKTGFKDAIDGLYDPPWNSGHRDHTSYCEGHTDGLRKLDREAYSWASVERGVDQDAA